MKSTEMFFFFCGCLAALADSAKLSLKKLMLASKYQGCCWGATQPCMCGQRGTRGSARCAFFLGQRGSTGSALDVFFFLKLSLLCLSFYTGPLGNEQEGHKTKIGEKRCGSAPAMCDV